MRNYLLIILLGITLSACGSHEKRLKNTILVGTIAGPETTLMETAQKVAKQDYGITIKIVPFSDYVMPNVALSDGSIDANMFQHLPYLNASKKSRKYQLVSIGKTFVYPMGIYSKKIKNLSQLKKNATVAIPNDPSNEGRALLLLQKAGLIALKQGVGFTATLNDIVKNPKQLQFKELDAAQLARVLTDVDLAIINTNYAVPAGLLPNRDALVLESKDSPYANIIVVRKADKDKMQLRLLVKALHSKQVLAKAKTIFKGQAIQAW